MPISIACPGCGRRLKAPDALAGRRLPCPNCKAEVQVPERPVEDAAAALLLGDEPAAEPAPSEAPAEPISEPARAPAPTYHRGPVKPPTPVSALPPLKSNEPPAWLRHLHWLLMLALIPLVVSLLHKGKEEELGNRILDSIEAAPEEEQLKILRILAKAEEGKADFGDLINAMPRHRLLGAALPRDSYMHWLFALGAAALFLGFFVFLATGGVADARHLLAIGAFTGTIGVLFLIIVQALAEATQGTVIVGRSIFVIFFWIAKLIGLSYRAALDPDNGFWVSFLGFTAGVGLCEEVVKAIPVLFRYRRNVDDNWRGAFLWGLASGAGFGIAEGIIYSSNYYNGIMGSGIYVVRFISCVALHALWTGSAAIAIQQKQGLLQSADRWYDMIAPTILFIAVPMVLHGLYDTLLKKDMPGIALVVALASFGYLAFQVSRLHGADTREATAEMLKEYKRRRKAMA
ncbi:MAG TPA: PrsW family glutamic-type intramembrane protease [Gemmataceae bacterium]|jgi:RsiW-degrading membrane proteinase PrsW (M82 family)|nr:PrsW family glutamic-type intramembrane protease [Gemmataceae bacterium]